MYNWNIFEDAEDKGVASGKKNHHRDLARNLIDAEVDIFYLPRITWAAT